MATISVILTTHNRPLSFFSRALNSILNQTFIDFEIVIVNDSDSNDINRNDIATFLHPMLQQNTNIKYIDLKSSYGSSYARNIGITTSSGQYITFLDDDDEYLPIKLDVQYKALISSDCLWVTGKRVTIKQNGSIHKDHYVYHSGYVYLDLLYTNFIPSVSPLICKTVFTEIGFFDVSVSSSDDYDLWLRIAEKFPLAVVDDPVINIYIHSGERKTTTYDKKYESVIQIITKHITALDKYQRLHARHIGKLIKYGILTKKPIGELISLYLQLLKLHLPTFLITVLKSVFWCNRR